MNISQFVISYILSFVLTSTFSYQNGGISVPNTVENDGEGSSGMPYDPDLESAVPTDTNKGGVKFGWIRGVLVSYVGSWRAPSAL